MNPDPNYILDLVIAGRKPACELWPLSAELIRKATMLGLEKYFFEYDGERYGIFALAGKPALPLVREAATLFKDAPFIENIENVIAEIQGMTVAAAIDYLGNRFTARHEAPDGPQCQILFGLFFGYPACCIRYLIEKGWGGKRHAFEAHEGPHFYLRCETCSKMDTWAPWCDARQS